jgi:hypothetical protein
VRLKNKKTHRQVGRVNDPLRIVISFFEILRFLRHFAGRGLEPLTFWMRRQELYHFAPSGDQAVRHIKLIFYVIKIVKKRL